MHSLWPLFLIAIPLWILSWYAGRMFLLNYQKRLGILKYCIHCGKRVGIY
ncbi:hypothetical protein LCGC14_0396140 [marine sediment metagenome]|uniref:Uncharacterized protein n=1 Tax=marine sediment metagenome TaxID=412755 RepID=A0A0F9TG21_9ZZZZ